MLDVLEDIREHDDIEMPFRQCNDDIALHKLKSLMREP